MNKYQASYYNADNQYTHEDFATADEAAKAVEAIGEGSVVKFHMTKNIPFAEPEYVHNSVALWVLDGGKWTAKSIFSMSCTSMHEERPY